MSPLELLFLALALSIDAFVVSLAATASRRVSGRRATFRLAFHFGLFQFLMPVLGWAAGRTLERYIVSIDHWIALGLLAFIGVRMIRSGLRHNPEVLPDDPSRGFTLLALAVGTSIDALAVGLTLGVINLDIWWPSLVIGCVTGTVCVIGIRLGTRIRTEFGRWSEVIGGLILIAIGVKILVDHLT
jgi:putative Mn2+ efflux pump MntP